MKIIDISSLANYGFEHNTEFFVDPTEVQIQILGITNLLNRQLKENRY